MEIKNTLNPLDPYNQSKLTNTNQAAKITARATATAPSQGAETGDRVSLSPEAKLRTEAFSAALNAPDMRVDKVTELKAKVASGEYNPDSKAIAAKLLAEEPGLFQA